MPLHLIKLCVGCDSVADLEDWIKQKLKEKKKRGQKAEHIHTTRMMPKRAEDLRDGGSLFWVIRGQIACRERMFTRATAQIARTLVVSPATVPRTSGQSSASIASAIG